MHRAEADVLVIGAGIAGLLAARRLTAAGLRALVIERGNVPGGRLATSRVGRGYADTGTQFFTVRSPEFAQIVDGWLQQGLVFVWSNGWSDGSLLNVFPDGYPRYAARGGFGALAQRLADGLTIRTGVSITSVALERGVWRATGADGFVAEATALLLTPPVPQSLALLDRSGVELPAVARSTLGLIQYGPCLCGLFAIEGTALLPSPGVLQRPDAPISWIADNRQKGISPEAGVLTVHMGIAAAEARWHQEDAAILAWMWAEVSPWLDTEATFGAARLIRWREAIPLRVHPDPYFSVETLPAPLLFAGDAFAGPRVEGAALSGMAAANALLGRMV